MYKNILLSCTLAIGDVVMATSAAALLKKIYPDVKISFMAKSLAEEIVYNNPTIDHVFAPHYAQKKLSLKTMRQLVSDIRKEKFDLFISLDGKLRPALLAWMAGIPVRVGPTCLFGSNTRMPMLLTHNIVVGDFKSTHYVEVLRDMISQFTGSDLAAEPVLPSVSKDDAVIVEKLIDILGNHRHIIGLCVKTNPLKMWPKEQFVELINRLGTKYDAGIYITGSDKYDQEYVEEVIAEASVPVANFCGRTSLPQLGELLRKTGLFISLDTAPMHIASAANTPMVAIFGSTAPLSVAPLSPKAVILAPSGLSCIPCIPNRIQVFPGISKRIAASSCPDQVCMKQITVEMVETAATRLLEEASAAG